MLVKYGLLLKLDYFLSALKDTDTLFNPHNVSGRNTIVSLQQSTCSVFWRFTSRNEIVANILGVNFSSAHFRCENQTIFENLFDVKIKSILFHSIRESKKTRFRCSNVSSCTFSYCTVMYMYFHKSRN